MKVYRTSEGTIAERDGRLRRVDVGWDQIFTVGDPRELVEHAFDRGGDVAQLPALLAPIQSQEVWGAGVTYLRSKKARMDESRDAGGGDFYDRVYEADRPELFFKATPNRVVGPGHAIRIRSDSKWNVPEPELTLAVGARGNLIGFTVGNDVSSRDIEGANPLYLPQAKVYLGSCALGPGLLLAPPGLGAETVIRLRIFREGASVFAGETSLSQMRRGLGELVDWLFRENDFPVGCFLMTGTGVIPPDTFTLQSGDRVEIEIPPIGTLINPVA